MLIVAEYRSCRQLCRCQYRWLLGPLVAIVALLVFPLNVRGADATQITKSEVVADERRTLAQFPANIGRGFAGVFQQESLRPFLAGVVAAGLSTLLDDEVHDAIADEDDEAADFADDYLGPVGLGLVTLGLFIGGRYSEDQRFRDMSYDLSVAFVVNLGYTGALKAAIGRERPNESDDDSFPSGHTSNAFALASVASAHYGNPVGIPAYGLASLIGLSRIRGNAHWLSDVVAGAALGHLVGRAVVRQNGSPLSIKLSAMRSVDIAPSLDPSFRGVVVGMNF
jgi:hypothetical protein